MTDTDDKPMSDAECNGMRPAQWAALNDEQRAAAVKANADAMKAGLTAAEWRSLTDADRDRLRKLPEVSKAEIHVIKGVQAIRDAVARAPSHEELFAACEALIRHLTDTPGEPTPAQRVGMTEAQWASLTDEQKALAEKQRADLVTGYEALTVEQRGPLTEQDWVEMTDAEREERLVPPVVVVPSASPRPVLAGAAAPRPAPISLSPLVPPPTPPAADAPNWPPHPVSSPGTPFTPPAPAQPVVAAPLTPPPHVEQN